MTDRTELHKLLDSRLDGVPAGVPQPDPIAVSWGIGASTWSEGNLAVYSLLSGNSWHPRNVLDVSGFGVVGSDGIAKLALSDFHCYFPPPDNFPGGWAADTPVNVTATARGSAPAYLTTETVLGPGPAGRPGLRFDVLITVFAWKPNGRPRPGVSFDWRCRAIIRGEPG